MRGLFCFIILIITYLHFMKLLFVIIFTALSALSCNAQFTIKHPDSLHLPKSIAYTGHIVSTAQWQDSLGNNLVIFTETGVHESDTPNDNGNRSAALYASHYIIANDSAKLF